MPSIHLNRTAILVALACLGLLLTALPLGLWAL
jgi:hypothetical protein